MRNFLYVILAGMFALVGFVIWDRRTALAPAVKKVEEELISITDKWIYFIKNAGTLECTPKTLNEVEIKKAFEIANTAGMSKEELEAQFKRHDFTGQSHEIS